MTDFKAGDKVVVRDCKSIPNWTKDKCYVVEAFGDGHLGVRSDNGGLWSLKNGCIEFTPAPDADGWYPMPKLKAGDPIPEWLVDERTEYRSSSKALRSWRVTEVTLNEILSGHYTHYRPAPQTVTATTADGKEYRITHGPDGSVSAEVV